MNLYPLIGRQIANALIGLFVFAISNQATALSFERPKPWILKLSGSITQGDSERFIEQLLKNSASAERLTEISTVQLASPGGDVLEAARISQILDLWFVRTEVPAKSECASSCFLLYLAGFKRDAEAAQPKGSQSVFGSVAIHRPVVENPQPGIANLQTNTRLQTIGMTAVRSHLSERHVPSYIIELMMQHASNEAYRLTDADLWKIGRYKPEIEETLIRSCDYQRRIDEALYTPKAEELTIDTIEAYDKQAERVAVCLQTTIELPYINQERPRIRERLATGWRPWKKH